MPLIDPPLIDPRTGRKYKRLSNEQPKRLFDLAYRALVNYDYEIPEHIEDIVRRKKEKREEFRRKCKEPFDHVARCKDLECTKPSCHGISPSDRFFRAFFGSMGPPDDAPVSMRPSAIGPEQYRESMLSMLSSSMLSSRISRVEYL